MTLRFWVPVRIAISGYAIIDAPTPEDAAAKAQDGDFDFRDILNEEPEAFQVTGFPELDDKQ